MNDKANWERTLHPNRGQVVLIKSRGYWATMDLYVRRVDKSLGWKVRIDKPVLGSETIRVSEVLRICATEDEAESIRNAIKDAQRELLNATNTAKQAIAAALGPKASWAPEVRENA